MPKFAANLTMLFNEVPFMERFDKAGAAGFKAVEFLFPYPFSAADIKSKLDSNGLQLILHNLPAGIGMRVSAELPVYPTEWMNLRQGFQKQLNTPRY
jgi:hydroxypyruvate isomerase